MFESQNEKIKALREEVKTQLIGGTPTPFKFSDVTMGHSKNSNGDTIIAKGKALFKFMTEKGGSTAMVTFDYLRNIRGSRKPYVTLEMTFSTSGVEFTDIVNFVDNGNGDKFHSTNLFASKVLFSDIEKLIQPLMANENINLMDSI